ncbi:pyridoxal phosphate-dependent transferase [Entophlyctis helioformis]|nr:pyridoxal phosphate-dependent transferase [Entophlyctis helioformis]
MSAAGAGAGVGAGVAGGSLLNNFGLVNDAARETAYQLVIAVNTTYTVASQVYASIPGASVVYKYVRASYQDDPMRTVLEACLVLFMVWYFVAKRYKPGSNEVVLSDKEVQELIDEWEPEPLVPDLTSFQKEDLAKTSILSSGSGLKVKSSDGKERLNFASFNFLGCMNSETIKEKAIGALRKYGVGTCGPSGFYGTIDVHMELEQRLASFVGTEAAIIYAQGFSCISSCIPAFAKRGDIIVADEAVNFAIHRGMHISRSNIRWFKHNDMKDLERVLKKVQADFANKPLTRRFIIAEGLYANLGDICPLPDLVALKHKYKFRLILEESMSFGVLGSRGAGAADMFNIPATEVDIMVASMSNALASAGGFCTGSKEVVEHQRLSSQAYTFSASLPAMLAVAAIEAINVVERDPGLLTTLASNAAIIRTTLQKICIPGVLTIPGDAESPLVHIQLTSGGSREDDDRILQEIVDAALKEGILVTRAKYVIKQEHVPPPPSIRVAVSAGFARRDVERCATVLRDSVRRVLKQRNLIK